LLIFFKYNSRFSPLTFAILQPGACLYAPEINGSSRHEPYSLVLYGNLMAPAAVSYGVACCVALRSTDVHMAA